MKPDQILLQFEQAGLPPPAKEWIDARAKVLESPRIDKPVRKKAPKPDNQRPEVVAPTVSEVGEVKPAIVVVQQEKKSLRERVQSGLLALLPLIFLGASFVGSVRSFSITKSFFARINSEFDSMVFAGLLVALSFAVPQALPILWVEIKKGKRIFLFGLTVMVSIATMGTNGFITAQELFSQRTDKLTATDSNEAKRGQVEALIADKVSALAEAKSNLAMDKEERATLLTAQVGLEVGSVTYNRIRNNISEIKTRVDAGIKTISAIDAELGQLRTDLAMIPPRSGLSVSREAEVAINVGIAMILELGAPLALSLSLYL